MKGIRLKKGQVIDLPVRRLGINGEGIGFYQKQVVFVEGAIPGETVRTRIAEVYSKYVRGKILQLKKASPHRVKAPCPVFRECGGCQLQHINYPKQLELKRELVVETFSRYTGRKDIPIQETIGMETPWNYRNKAQLPLKNLDSRLVMGLYAAGSHRLIDVGNCGVQHPLTNQILETTRKVLEEMSVPVYHEKKHRGTIRYLATRIGLTTGEAQLILISRTSHLPYEAEVVRRLRERLPQVVSIVVNVNPQRTSRVFGEKTRVLWGEEKMKEKLGSLTFALSAPAFFQLNPVQTVKLYDEVKRLAGLTGRETLVDAYCGSGTIGLWLAHKVKQVRGMDTVPEAIEDARENARINGIENVTYDVGAAENLLPDWLDQGFRPDVVVADPPRTGLGKAFMEALIRIQVPRFVYVSCNPSTLAKDCNRLIQSGYRVEAVVPVDMFPQTSQVECCTLLVHESSSREG
ncbi:23S rRNA (uracil(1939)-C(5))-methyltransferase RlmD [Melghirimyces algeriensis]|uniref:23S rRNA m(5)U-1939 methyltransferase n=1 Tax=Melghirimyces algeriensis TaxID=910412 RepID=A0A521ERI0_9BACL|nr:23S rRNA (uracil(1939)-C(5))-methyltransferase RlmD [Melghirimyces algeriensis]SMO86507.1 23S rRNA m(5)U-1939 methyltransferase [Melghirimyces algeriensis]